MDDEVFEGGGGGLKEEEFERTRRYPSLEHEVAGEVEKS